MAKAPGKADRKGISLVETVRRFGDDAKAEAWFVEQRWPDGVRCVDCGSERVKQRKPNARRKTALYHCNACKHDFTVKTGTIMHDSRLPLSTWALAFYLFSTHLKGVSSMKLHRDLEITQESAWHLAHRIREAWGKEAVAFSGPVEVDESHFGGREKNKHTRKKLGSDWPLGKTIVAGIKDRTTNQIQAAVVPATDGATLKGFVIARTDNGARVYTDDHPAYRGLRNHATVRHGVGEYVREQAHINGVESFWSLLKRGYQGTHHQISAKHLDRYVGEFAGRHNVRTLDTIDQMRTLARGSAGKRLRYRELVA